MIEELYKLWEHLMWMLKLGASIYDEEVEWQMDRIEEGFQVLLEEAKE